MQHCSVPSCMNKLKCRALCSTHYKQVIKHGGVRSITIDLHGDTKSTEYRSWGQMKARCYNKNHHAYMRYGGRGILVCDRWRTSYSHFLADMGRKPNKTYSLDRLSPNGNYEPSNCRWASYNEQATTRRNSKPNVGVIFDRNTKTWRASLTFKGVRVLHKRFKRYEDAISARQKANEKYLGSQQLFF